MISLEWSADRLPDVELAPIGVGQMAPNKKYLSLEEAAIELGLNPEELVRLREKGQVRGFADRGTWKFKADDIDEYRRSQQPDSDPDLPMYDDDDFDTENSATRQMDIMKSDSDVRLRPLDQSKKNLLSGSSAELNALQLQSSDSDVRLVEDPRIKKPKSDSDVTIVKPKSGLKSDSDSDVRMVAKDERQSDSDVKLLDPDSPKTDSDSDVRMSESDSDVRMAASDSDVRLAPLSSGNSQDASDSDIRLAPLPDSDSDVKLLRKPERDSDSDVMLLPRGHKTTPESNDLLPLADSSITLAGDSGIRLSGGSGIKGGGDSSIKIADDSGIALNEDSGIRLGGDSGIRLSEDSGIQLLQPADSGISLEGDSGIRFAEDSGISIGPDSGIKLSSPSGGKKRKGDSSRNLRDKKDDIDSTAPMLLSSFDDEEDNANQLSGEFNVSDTSELPSLTESGHDVELFDDEDDATRTLPKKKPASDSSMFEIDEEEDDHTMALEELEVSDEDLHDDGDFEDLDFDAGDDILEDSFAEASDEISYAGSNRKIAVPREIEWTAGTCGLLFLSLCLLVVGSIVSADLLRTVWAGESNIDQGLVTMFASFWK